MSVESIKLDLISWISRLNDKDILNEMLNIKNKANSKMNDEKRKIYGAGKDMFGHVAEDFDDPIDEFKEYEK